MRPSLVITLVALTVVFFVLAVIVISGGCAEGVHPMSCPPHTLFADLMPKPAWRTPVLKLSSEP